MTGKLLQACVKKTKSLFRYLFDSDFRFVIDSNRTNKYDRISDEMFLKKKYKVLMHRNLDLDCPKLYTEKLQWLKLYDRNPLYTVLVDKIAAKEFVSNLIGEEYVIPTIGTWNSADEIDFDLLPEKFVIKCNHNSGLGMCICHDKKNINVSKVRRALNRGLKQDYYMTGREWPYKNVRRRIIAEKYMEDSRYGELRDYKFFTFDGVPKVLYITQGRGSDEETVADFFDMDFNHLPFTIDHNMADVLPEKPANFELMKELAAKLSQGTPQLRVDFYEVDGKVYFGEMTFFHCSGFEKFSPEKWDTIFGEWITLPPPKKED